MSKPAPAKSLYQSASALLAVWESIPAPTRPRWLAAAVSDLRASVVAESGKRSHATAGRKPSPLVPQIREMLIAGATSAKIKSVIRVSDGVIQRVRNELRATPSEKPPVRKPRQRND